MLDSHLHHALSSFCTERSIFHFTSTGHFDGSFHQERSVLSVRINNSSFVTLPDSWSKLTKFQGFDCPIIFKLQIDFTDQTLNISNVYSIENEINYLQIFRHQDCYQLLDKLACKYWLLFDEWKNFLQSICALFARNWLKMSNN